MHVPDLCLRKSACVALLLFGAAAGTQAQTANAPAASPNKKADDVVSLSEFTVSEKSSSNSYIASETMTGSRVNEKIANLPYSIVNLTTEFFKDFNIDVLDENMTYIGGLTGINIGGSFNLRGFSSTSQLRDGFYRLGRYGLSNIDRVEIIRGPNAAIYGRSSPGGMVNFVGLQPKKQDQQIFKISEGSYKQGKADLQMTGAFDAAAKTYYVLKLNQTSRQFPGQYAQIRNNEFFGAVQHDFSSTSHLKVSGEFFLQVQHAAQSGAPIVSQARVATPDNAATTTVIGYDMALASFNPLGPRSELNRGSATYQAIYDNQFNSIWSTRVGAYYFRARRWDFNNNAWGAITIPLAAGAAVTSTRSATMGRGEIMEDGGGFQADLVAHYFLANHTIESKTLLTVDLNDYYRWDPTWSMPVTDPAVVVWNAAGSGRIVTLVPGVYEGRADYIPSAPIAYFNSTYDPGNLTITALTRRRTTSLGGNIRQQMIFMDGRLITYAGLRIDNVRFSQRDALVNFASVGFGTLPPGQGGPGQPGGNMVRRFVHQNKPNAGFSYAVRPNLRLYSSFSSAYFVDQTSRPAVIAASTYAPFTSKGIDYGLKGSYFDQKLNFTVGGYYNKQFNVLVNDAIETPPGSGVFVNTPRQDGNQLVRGWEADLSYVVNNEVTVGSSFGRVDSKYTFFGSTAPQVVGRSVNGISPENGSAYLKYSPVSGALKGFYFNALATYVSSTPTQAPNAGDTTVIVAGSGGKVNVTAHTDAWKLRLPSFTLWEFAVHYRLPRLNQHWDQEISLNLKNAFDVYYLKTSALRGDGRGLVLTYQLTHGGSPRF